MARWWGLVGGGSNAGSIAAGRYPDPARRSRWDRRGLPARPQVAGHDSRGSARIGPTKEERDAARMYCRRFHRCLGPGQHADRGRHEDGPDHRRSAGRRDGRADRGRRRRRRAQVTQRRRGRGRRAEPGGARLVAGRGRAPVPVQVLLDLRLHARRQHRPGGRGVDGRPRYRFHDCLPGVPGQSPNRVPGPPVRRRPAAERESGWSITRSRR